MSQAHEQGLNANQEESLIDFGMRKHTVVRLHPHEYHYHACLCHCPLCHDCPLLPLTHLLLFVFCLVQQWEWLSSQSSLYIRWQSGEPSQAVQGPLLVADLQYSREVQSQLSDSFKLAHSDVV